MHHHLCIILLLFFIFLLSSTLVNVLLEYPSGEVKQIPACPHPRKLNINNNKKELKSAQIDAEGWQVK